MGNNNTIGKTLYIIGNGFDIAHGIKSKYSDFKNWCEKRNINTQIDFLLNLNADWSNIEEALGKDGTEDPIYENLDPYDGVYKGENPFNVSAKIKDSVKFLFKETMNFLKPALKKWVDSIEIDNIKHKHIYTLEPDAYYLTFNYTETLEKFYNIPSKQICHIHGSRLVKDDEYVFGHDNKREISIRNEDRLYDWEVNAKKAIIEYMNGFEKPYESRKNILVDFINGKKIDKIIVYGHSLGRVDWQYFEKIVELLGCKIPWEVDCFDDADVKRMHILENHLGLLNIKNKNTTIKTTTK